MQNVTEAPGVAEKQPCDVCRRSTALTELWACADHELCQDKLCYFEWSVAEYDIEECIEEDRTKLVAEGWTGGYPDAD